MDYIQFKNKLLFLSLGILAGIFTTLAIQSMIPEDGNAPNWINISLNGIAILFLIYRIYYHLILKNK